MTHKYIPYAIVFAVFYTSHAICMRRVPAIHTSIARIADFYSAPIKYNYNDRSIPLNEIAGYFEILYTQAYNDSDSVEGLAQLRRVRVGVKRAPSPRAGYVSAIKYLEQLLAINKT